MTDEKQPEDKIEDKSSEMTPRWGPPRMVDPHNRGADDYMMVQSRVDLFHQYNPEATLDVVALTIKTEPVDVTEFGLESGVGFMTTVTCELASGKITEANDYAFDDVVNPNTVKKCATASKGRALNTLGFAGPGEFASAEEMETVRDGNAKQHQGSSRGSQQQQNKGGGKQQQSAPDSIPSNKDTKRDPSQLVVTDDGKFVYAKGNVFAVTDGKKLYEHLKAAKWQFDGDKAIWYSKFDGDASVIDAVSKHFDTAPQNLKPPEAKEPEKATAPTSQSSTLTYRQQVNNVTNTQVFKDICTHQFGSVTAFWNHIQKRYDAATSDDIQDHMWYDLLMKIEPMTENTIDNRAALHEFVHAKYVDPGFDDDQQDQDNIPF